MAERSATLRPSSEPGSSTRSSSAQYSRAPSGSAAEGTSRCARRIAASEASLRLGKHRTLMMAAIGSPVDEVRDAYVRALAVAAAGSDARREALLTLADKDRKAHAIGGIDGMVFVIDED